jgi:hypothetical protein
LPLPRPISSTDCNFSPVIQNKVPRPYATCDRRRSSGKRGKLGLDAIDLRLSDRPEQRMNRREELVGKRHPVRRARRSSRRL